MKKVSIEFIIGATVIATVHDAYVIEGCLLMELDNEGNKVKLIPLHTTACIDLEIIDDTEVTYA